MAQSQNQSRKMRQTSVTADRAERSRAETGSSRSEAQSQYLWENASSQLSHDAHPPAASRWLLAACLGGARCGGGCCSVSASVTQCRAKEEMRSVCDCAPKGKSQALREKCRTELWVISSQNLVLFNRGKDISGEIDIKGSIFESSNYNWYNKCMSCYNNFFIVILYNLIIIGGIFSKEE